MCGSLRWRRGAAPASPTAEARPTIRRSPPSLRHCAPLPRALHRAAAAASARRLAARSTPVNLTHSLVQQPHGDVVGLAIAVSKRDDTAAGRWGKGEVAAIAR